MLKGLKRLAGGGILLLELRGIRRDLGLLSASVARIAEALELRNAHQWPTRVTGPLPDGPPVEITYADGEQQREFMEIELRLTAARGMPPSEDEVIEEFNRMHAGEAQA